MKLSQVSSNYLQQITGGIFLPLQVDYAVSDNGIDFRVVATITHDVPLRQEGPLIHAFTTKLPDVAGRYLRVSARNVRIIPDWHPANGQKAWLFADEIVVNPVAKREK